METASLTDAQRRTIWRQWRKARVRQLRDHQRRRTRIIDTVNSGELSTAELQQAALDLSKPIHLLPFPAACVGLRCGAATKSSGLPCKRRDLRRGLRCKLHSGMSTGARTPEGKRRAAANGFMPKRRKRTS